MNDEKIIELYWQRSEEAISETSVKYGRYCHKVAYNVLYSETDADECVNDTYMRAWNSIPPQRPVRLLAFLAKITRNLAINRYSRARSAKRYCTIQLVLDELSEVVPDNASGAESITDSIVIRDSLNSFLSSLPALSRVVFVQRYFYLSTVKEIAKNNFISESNAKIILHRLRERLKSHLNMEGIEI